MISVRVLLKQKLLHFFCTRCGRTAVTLLRATPVASIQKKGDSWYCQFMYHGKRHTFTIGKVDDSEATATAAKADYVLMRLKQRLLSIPPGMDIVTFIQFDGKPPPDSPATRDECTLAYLRDSYLDKHSNGTLEQTTLDGIGQHFRHWGDTLGERFPVSSLGLSDLQRHVDRRARMKGIRGRISPATIKKEIVTLRTAWNWGVQFGLVTGRFPNRGLRYPKSEEKFPFMTWQEIERQIAAGGDPDELWECLYLQVKETAELLRYVKDHAALPWIYPMFCFAAHTGARRSEIIRARVVDVDFAEGVITIREKKRARGQRTSRRVPMSSFLKQVLTRWMRERPAADALFCQDTGVIRSKTKRTMPTAITRDEAHDHFKRTLADGRWRVLRGWHVLRHSFVSACASRGVDQRLIDAWVGHTTEEMRRRYRHLYPSTQQEAISRVFG
jgi:integrase